VLCRENQTGRAASPGLSSSVYFWFATCLNDQWRGTSPVAGIRWRREHDDTVRRHVSERPRPCAHSSRRCAPRQCAARGKVWRIGQLLTGGGWDSGLDAFRLRLDELGYVEGQNLLIEYRNAEGRAERFPALAAELVRLNVDVIVTLGTQAAFAAKQATTVIPIVMGSSGDAMGIGLVQSLARPGGNVTGLTGISPELSGKRLELLKEAFPKKSRVALLWNPANPLDVLEYKATVAAAPALGLMLQPLEVRVPEKIETGFAAATKARADLLVVFPDPVFGTARTQIVGPAAKHRLPAMYVWREDTVAGGLMSYGPSLSDSLRRAATYVDKILKGRQARRPPGRAADEVRASDQSQDRQDPRADDPAVDPLPGRSGNRIARAGPRPGARPGRGAGARSGARLDSPAACG
jgi:ABC-type uncharacterized transport system substrate-binding protein